ncbi:MAG: branched-chain amino acid ABC transporter permease [Bacillota bacterium]
MFLQQVVNGLGIGSIYALMAVGYSLVYSLLNFTNFAHGIVVTTGAYVGFYALAQWNMPLAAGVLTAMVGGAIISILYERLTYRPLRLRGAKTLYLIITGMGLSVFFENFVIIEIGPRFKALPNPFGLDGVSFLGTIIPTLDLIILVVSLLSLIMLQAAISKTKFGLATRAAAFNLPAAGLMGVNTDALVGIVFVVAGAFAGLAGVFLGLKYIAYPQLGWMTMKAFISAVFGGLGSLPGAVLGAYLLGLIETFVAAYISSSLRDIFAFLLLILILVIKPSGLMGVSAEEKA